jgi:CRP-like cAMP-binding protein
MTIDFVDPEARIIKQNDNREENNYMFFIERGSCIVQINDKDKMRNKSKKVRQLYPGDYFGEIAFLYDSKRSTSVTSTNYTTLGKIPKEDVTKLFESYPFFKQELIKRSISYDDDLKIFLESALKTIDYLQEVPDETINKIIFSMTFAKFDKGASIFKVDQASYIMLIIQNGMVEIYTTMDNGVEFVIERLYRGSVINHRSFIIEDKIDVSARCQMPVTLFYIQWDKMKDIKKSCNVLNKKIEAVELALINKENPIALDYIISRDISTVRGKSKKRNRKE